MSTEHKKGIQTYKLEDGREGAVLNVPYMVHKSGMESLSYKDAIIVSRIFKHMNEQGLTEYNFEDWQFDWDGNPIT